MLGGCTIMMFGNIIVSGFQMIASAGFSQRNITIAALSLAVGIGFTQMSDIFVIFPDLLQSTAVLKRLRRQLRGHGVRGGHFGQPASAEGREGARAAGGGRGPVSTRGRLRRLGVTGGAVCCGD